VSNSEPISARNGLKESARLGQSLVRIIKAPQLQDIRSSQDMIQEETRKKRSRRRRRRWIRKQAHAQNGAGDGQAQRLPIACCPGDPDLQYIGMFGI